MRIIKAIIGLMVVVSTMVFVFLLSVWHGLSLIIGMHEFLWKYRVRKSGSYFYPEIRTPKGFRPYKYRVRNDKAWRTERFVTKKEAIMFINDRRMGIDTPVEYFIFMSNEKEDSNMYS